MLDVNMCVCIDLRIIHVVVGGGLIRVEFYQMLHQHWTGKDH